MTVGRSCLVALAVGLALVVTDPGLVPVGAQGRKHVVGAAIDLPGRPPSGAARSATASRLFWTRSTPTAATTDQGRTHHAGSVTVPPIASVSGQALFARTTG
jgi:hypothetical protein